ncbi:Copia protein, partial [Mucuna pruriens]
MGNIERYKTRLVAKNFTQKEDINKKETFSPISSTDSFRTIMTLVTHFNVELHQMDVKIVFLNGDIDETIYIMQLKNFVSNESKNSSLASNRLPVNDITNFIKSLRHVVSRQM